MNPTLLAKSPRARGSLTLLQHLLDTEQAACALFREGTRWSASYARFFGLDGAARVLFLRHLRIAALFHDVGKANEDFQAAMTAKGIKAQSLRHEHLSALLMSEPAIAAWLSASPELDVDVLVAAVLSHHLKAARDGDWAVLLPRHATPTKLYFDDGQIRAALARIAEVAGLPAYAAALPALRYRDDAWSAAYDRLFERADLFSSQLAKSAARLCLTLAVKAGLIVADSVSSGLWREELDLQGWIDGVAHGPALGAEDIEAGVLQPRITELGGRWQGWHRFQEGAATVGRRALLLAGCGAGKTLAAWRWAQAVSASEPIGRVVFLYPTRGTATEGFRDYVGHAPEGEAVLVHGTSAYELAGMMDNPEEVPPSLRGKNVAPDESEARLFGLGLWTKRYFSATVDQFLGFVEHSYASLVLLPALADAAVVFDEIHSYDPKMWNALVTFLERFDVPVLCMTATLPPSRRVQLEERAGLRTYPTAVDRQELRDLERSEAHPRYRLRPTSSSEALAHAIDALGQGQRVLWVVNTVRRCQQVARALRLQVGDATVGVGVYHSRFRLDDRKRRHRETVDAFRAPTAGGARCGVAVTTQVCEMSLDLDADVLITEHAPISSLVQRFGRANRHLTRGPDFRARLLTYAPESHLPYDRRELEAAATFLASLADRDISQRDMAEALEVHARSERAARGATAFLDGGYFATPGALRDSDDQGAAVVLDADIPRYRELVACDEPTDGLRLTVPKRHARTAVGAGLPTWLRTADASRYDPWLGFVDDDSASPHTGATP